MLSATYSSKLLAICMSIVMVVLMKDTEAKPHTLREKTVPLHLDNKALVPKHTTRSLSNHSISPWTYNTTIDPDCFPHITSEAKCSLQGCLNAQGVQDLTLESKPIQYETLYLRKVKGSDGYHYRLESRLISVGCTCVRPSVRYQH